MTGMERGAKGSGGTLFNSARTWWSSSHLQKARSVIKIIRASKALFWLGLQFLVQSLSTKLHPGQWFAAQY